MSAPTYAVYDPATLELVGEAPQHTEEDVRACVRAFVESRAALADA